MRIGSAEAYVLGPGRLPESMDTSVGSTRAKDSHVRPAKPLHCFLEHSLDGPSIGLALPSGEPSPVILKNELQRSRFHCANYRDTEEAATTLTFIVATSKLGNAFPKD